MENREAVLRRKLKDSLNSKTLNFDEFLELSRELITYDNDVVRFRVDAGLITRLGRELVGKKETAVSELVKNAYDADARRVTITFDSTERKGGRLVIADDGDGMSREQLIRGFMRLSTSEKILNPRSPRYGRARAGRKGIGRFAAQRLGGKLTLWTQPRDGANSFQVSFDWTRFSGVDLETVSNSLSLGPKSNNAGTVLTIIDLADEWSREEILEVYDDLLELLQPEKLRPETTHSKGDPGFKVSVVIRNKKGSEIISPDREDITDHSLAVIEGFVTNTGEGVWSIDSDILKLHTDGRLGPDREKPDSRYKNLRGVYFKAYYFIYAPEYLARRQGHVKAYVQKHGGIKVYRNGFRVRPYGDPNNDWLALDLSSRTRGVLPPHANTNFIGFVDLLDQEGKTFEETSSREGLINNPAYTELVDYILRSLVTGIQRVAEIRGRKQTASQKGWQRSGPARLEYISKRLIGLAKELEQGKASSGVAQQVRLLSQNLTEEGRQQEALLEELAMLRILSSLGLAIGEFTHEIRHYLPALQADLKFFKKAMAGNENAERIIPRMSANFRTLLDYSSYFDRAVSANVARELRPQAIQDVVGTFVSFAKPIALRASIIVSDEIEEENLFTRPMHPSEWASILFNLFTNSKKAIKRAQRPGKILIRGGKSRGYVFLEFSDNGDGIAEGNRDRIFNAFFTTSEPAKLLSADSEELLGTGLGLKVVSDIVTSAGGNIKIVDPPVGYNTCFRVEIPAASKDDMNAAV